jgi:hypothetical protein
MRNSRLEPKIGCACSLQRQPLNNRMQPTRAVHSMLTGSFVRPRPFFRRGLLCLYHNDHVVLRIRRYCFIFVFFNQSNSFFVDQQLMTSSFVNHARLAVATP